MREIKFRVWDKQRHEWVKQTGNPYIFPFEGRVAMICAGSATGHISNEDYSEFYELVGYTGLKDKNGKEIYEGDIVQVYSKRDSMFSEKANIIFYANGWCVDASPYYSKCREGWCVRIHEEMTLEIIGNIYENPELMEVGSK